MNDLHTPGPWTVTPANDGATYITGGEPRDDGSFQGLACMLDDLRDDDDSEESAANARLMAAAPDLLAACEAALKQLNELEAYIFEQTRARVSAPASAALSAAIAKVGCE